MLLCCVLPWCLIVSLLLDCLGLLRLPPYLPTPTVSVSHWLTCCNHDCMDVTQAVSVSPYASFVSPQLGQCVAITTSVCPWLPRCALLSSTAAMYRWQPQNTPSCLGAPLCSALPELVEERGHSKMKSFGL